MNNVKLIRLKDVDKFQQGDILIYKKRGGGEKYIPPEKYWLDRNTPIGEPADLWERMPHGGKRLLDWNKVIGSLRLDKKQL